MACSRNPQHRENDHLGQGRNIAEATTPDVAAATSRALDQARLPQAEKAEREEQRENAEQEVRKGCISPAHPHSRRWRTTRSFIRRLCAIRISDLQPFLSQRISSVKHRLTASRLFGPSRPLRERSHASILALHNSAYGHQIRSK